MSTKSSLKERLGQILIEKKLITPSQLSAAFDLQKEKKERLGDVLVEAGYISKEALMEILSVELHTPYVELSPLKVSKEVIALVPKKIADYYGLVPVSCAEGKLSVAMRDPLNVNAIDDLRRATGLTICPLLASAKDIREAIDLYYAENVKQAIQDVMKGMTEKEAQLRDDAVSFGPSEGSRQELLRLTEEEPIVRMTNSILAEGVKRRSSDIFVEPEEKNMRVRYRVDGLLQEGVLASRAMHAGVVSRIKVMSALDIAEHRIPQDGRIKIKVKERYVDFRVSVLPSYFGEKVVLRILDKNQTILDIERLGFEPSPLQALKKAVSHPHGMVAVCGPTGSGKTTTLYSVLKLIDDPQKNLVTVEDPVEYQIEGINQVAIRPEVKLTFASALRSILRQDPDIVMVGEIRDSETADVAIKAALTGHLVLSTLHATTAVGAITRFINMGIEPFLITSSLLLAASQRLVRKVCLKCKESYEPSRELLKQLGVKEKDLNGKTPLFWRGQGCDRCGKKAYTGRAVLLEALTLSPTVKAMILKGAQEHELKRQGCAEGMMTLRENGIAKVLQGITTPEEVIRVTVMDEDK